MAMAMTTPAILRKAAMRVREGWRQGDAHDGLKVCALRALGVSAPNSRESFLARCALQSLVPNQSVANWNDAYAESAEEVAMTMELCALLVEEGNDAVQG